MLMFSRSAENTGPIAVAKIKPMTDQPDTILILSKLSFQLKMWSVGPYIHHILYIRARGVVYIDGSKISILFELAYQ